MMIFEGYVLSCLTQCGSTVIRYSRNRFDAHLLRLGKALHIASQIRGS